MTHVVVTKSLQSNWQLVYITNHSTENKINTTQNNTDSGILA